jgi:chorismate mutase/prephenate dehydratase
VSEHTDDPTLARLREQIEAADRELLDAFLRRLAVARHVRHHKEEHGYTFVDAGREQELLERWLAAADGALSDEAVEELFATVLALSKREAQR